MRHQRVVKISLTEAFTAEASIYIKYSVSGSIVSEGSSFSLQSADTPSCKPTTLFRNPTRIRLVLLLYSFVSFLVETVKKPSCLILEKKRLKQPLNSTVSKIKLPQPDFMRTCILATLIQSFIILVYKNKNSFFNSTCVNYRKAGFVHLFTWVTIRGLMTKKKNPN